MAGYVITQWSILNRPIMHESEWIPQWALLEKFVKLSFWGLNIGLALMVITNLFPEGILPVWVVLENGYWHARSLEFIGTDRIRMLDWVSMSSYLILIIIGVVPIGDCLGIDLLEDKERLIL